MSRDRDRLRHILDAIAKIERYAVEGEDRFRRDELVQSWMVHHLQVIGEAARALSEPFREQYPGVPWKSIIGMRHVLVHDYIGIDLEIVWRVVSGELAELRPKIEAILEELDGDA